MNAVPSIPFARPWITDAERNAVMDVLCGDILTHGPQNEAFEEEFARFIGGGVRCVAVSSCMAALHLTYLQLRIGSGDEVIVPAQTHVATAHAVEAVGAKPVFVDCELQTGNIDAKKIEAAITPRTRAVGLVHFVGIPCDMSAIMEVARRHEILVVEDCALAVGTKFDGKHVGQFGNAGCFSFYPVKHITTGDGGMFVTTDHTLAAEVKRTRGFGVDRTFGERKIPGMYDVLSFGLNYRMSDINAALGRVQLSRVATILDMRRRNFMRLKGALEGLQNVVILDSPAENFANSHYCLTAVLRGPLAEKRNGIIAALREAGVGTSIYYPQPVPRMTYYREKYGYDPNLYHNAIAISDHSIALPVGPHLSDQDISHIEEAFHRTFKEFDK